MSPFPSVCVACTWDVHVWVWVWESVCYVDVDANVTLWHAQVLKQTNTSIHTAFKQRPNEHSYELTNIDDNTGTENPYKCKNRIKKKKKKKKHTNYERMKRIGFTINFVVNILEIVYSVTLMCCYSKNTISQQSRRELRNTIS